jgi:phosphoribosylglycinamide formyltransferase 1
MKIVVIASTNGGILSALLRNDYARPRISEVISDRPCGAISVARSHNISSHIFETSDSLAFSDYLLSRYSDRAVDLYLSFYTRLFKGQFLAFAEHKLINLHPSILPACPGMTAFEDTIKSRSKFIGATLHFVDSGMDTGCPIIQAAVPFNPNLTIAENRHTVFMLQYRMLVQAIKWFEEKRVIVGADGETRIDNAEYAEGPFSPNLDGDLERIL